MNFAQFALFIVYFFSIFFIGTLVFTFLSRNEKQFINRWLYLGEVFLLGSIVLVGQLLLLSICGLYKAHFLWAMVLLNYLSLFDKNTRNSVVTLFYIKSVISIPAIMFVIFIIILIFRNCYFRVDVDSISTYLFAQKLWLSSGSSIIGSIANDARIFIPHFDTLPCSLGISVFGQETLFPELVDLLWRVIVLLLVFGYTSYRFNEYFGLAAAMLIIFDGHFFYSGANQWVLINSALIAFMFGAVYNFWEASVQKNPFRFLLAIIFTSQLLANKYQMLYFSVFVLTLGVFIQLRPKETIGEILNNKRWLFAFLIGCFFMSLWYFKNLFITGDPMFPILAGKLKVFNWLPEQGNVFFKLFGGIKPALFVKYMNYFFIWPGVNSVKYLAIAVSFLPLIFVISTFRRNMNKNSFFELNYWLALCILALMGICLSSHQDPRYFRYPIAIFSYTAVFFINYIFKYCFNIRKEIFINGIILLLALPGYKTVYQGGGNFNRPTIRENLDVLFDKIHVDYAIRKHYPQVPVILKEIEKQSDKFKIGAWDMAGGINFPAFFLPIKPTVSLWVTTLISWDSYAEANLIISDLKRYGIGWIAVFRDNKLIFLSAEEYAKEAVKYDRYPNKIYYDYNFPPELSRIKY